LFLLCINKARGITNYVEYTRLAKITEYFSQQRLPDEKNVQADDIGYKLMFVDDDDDDDDEIAYFTVR